MDFSLLIDVSAQYSAHLGMAKVVKDWGADRKISRLQVSLCDISEPVCASLATAFELHSNVRVIFGDILSFSTDALVTASNSFGDMGGGVDRAIDLACKGEAQQTVQNLIRSECLGELPVGQALLVPVAERRLIVAPTMRIPGSISGTINAYLAFRAAFVLIAKHNEASPTPILSVAVPGLGCGVGGLSPEETAQQMEAAYSNIAEGGWMHAVHPALAPFACY